ncbi:hypothetical protein OIU84_009944 [Salix udensis]|uniref:Sulfate transporter n=1 Tax=Salix udensis TaxID=889485 RepID=A0AAD6NVB7_9ROSI|nr:hypothetical protein OIU84_009944 [Salix udensis]
MVFLLGVVLAFIRRPGVVDGFKFGPSSIEIVKISKHAWKEGFVKGAIPQLPLSVLNSVIAVCKLSSDLFPGKDFSASSVSVSVGMMNIVGCWFGAMPCCHGAGGLAGQYKFGGRSGGLCGSTRSSQIGSGFGFRQLLSDGPEPISGRGPRGAAIVCRDRVGHGFKGHEHEGGSLCDAYMRCRFTGGFKCSTGLSVRDCCARASQIEKLARKRPAMSCCKRVTPGCQCRCKRVTSEIRNDLAHA